MLHFNKTEVNNFVEDAGVIMNTFDTKTGKIVESDILFATSGGVSISVVPTFKDYGEDLDGVPANVKELKRITGYEIKISGTSATITPESAKSLIGAADVSSAVVKLRNKLADTDFSDLYFVVDKSATNKRAYYKFCNALSTGGFTTQTTDKDKGKFSFEYTAHASIETPDEVPFEYGEITLTTLTTSGS